jgi:biotin carboxyl carrier protein
MSKEVKAPMPGKITKILVAIGDEVTEDDEVLTLEAMKMENPIYPDGSGRVKQILVREGDSVSVDQTLFVLE